jgi:hypothetical protein
MSNLGHDAAGSAANAAYFGAFLVKGNRFGFFTATSPKKIACGAGLQRTAACAAASAGSVPAEREHCTPD